MPEVVVDAIAVALRVGAAIEAAGGAYFVGGSLASSLQGEPRATNDVDVVLTLPLGRIQALVAALGADFEVDVDMLRDALLHGRGCNVFYLPMVMKVDLFAVGPTPFDEAEFSRRRPVIVRGDQTLVHQREGRNPPRRRGPLLPEARRRSPAPPRRATLRRWGRRPDERVRARAAVASSCGGWKDEMITLVEQGPVCRPCVTRVGGAILAMSPTAVARLWPVSAAARETRRGAPPAVELDVEEVLAAFRTGLARHLSADALVHLDLAQAYGEMGLMGDAVREAATALGERAPATIASQALNWLFSPGRAEPDALRSIARALRSE